jgi:hypothetical protein
VTISVSDVWAALRDAQREIEALKAENARLREELIAYRDAVHVDVLLEGLGLPAATRAGCEKRGS